MHVPPAFQRSDDLALLCELAEPETDAVSTAGPAGDHGSTAGPAGGCGSAGPAGDCGSAAGPAGGGGSAVGPAGDCDSAAGPAGGRGSAGGPAGAGRAAGGPAGGAGSGTGVVLDGWRPGYLVVRGRVDVFALRRRFAPHPADRGRRVATLQRGAVMPSSTVLGAWQLALVPAPGSRLRPLSTGRLRAIGYGEPSAPPDALVPAPRAVSVVVAALARGLDAALLTVADALRNGDPPAHGVPIRPGQFVSLDAGAAVTTGGGVCWVRVAGGHARRNGEDATVFGGAEPALIAGRDWITVDGPATAEATTTADLLATGHLPAALDEHMVFVLRSIGRRLGPDD
jgi:hypothetical protein